MKKWEESAALELAARHPDVSLGKARVMVMRPAMHEALQKRRSLRKDVRAAERLAESRRAGTARLAETARRHVAEVLGRGARVLAAVAENTAAGQRALQESSNEDLAVLASAVMSGRTGGAAAPVRPPARGTGGLVESIADGADGLLERASNEDLAALAGAAMTSGRTREASPFWRGPGDRNA